jgi:hypothetical protein
MVGMLGVIGQGIVDGGWCADDNASRGMTWHTSANSTRPSLALLLEYNTQLSSLAANIRPHVLLRNSSSPETRSPRGNFLRKVVNKLADLNPFSFYSKLSTS